MLKIDSYQNLLELLIQRKKEKLLGKNLYEFLKKKLKKLELLIS